MNTKDKRAFSHQKLVRASTLVLILTSFIICLCSYFDCYAEQRDAAFVKRVFDGDTLLVMIHDTEEKVRLIGVDTPEKNHPLKPVQFFSREATQFVERLVAGKNVFLEYDWQQRDKYGRLLAYVYLEDGRLLNAEIIKEGFGFAYLKYSFRRLEEFKKYEKQARRKERGLWENQGMREWRWLISMDRKPFRVYEMAGALWGIEFSGFIKLRLNGEDLLSELSHLRIWVHEYHQEDLREILLQNGWMESPQGK